MGIVEGAEINLSPRLQAIVNFLKEDNILRIIFAQDVPCFAISLHAGSPEMGARVRELATAAELASEIIELITRELTHLPAYLKGVNRLKWRGGWEPINNESRPDFPYIEGVSIVSDDEIGLIEDFPEMSTEGKIAVSLFGIIGIIAETIGLDRFCPLPHYGKAK